MNLRVIPDKWRSFEENKDVGLILIISASSCEGIIGGFAMKKWKQPPNARGSLKSNLFYISYYPCGVHLPAFGWFFGNSYQRWMLMDAYGCLWMLELCAT